MIWGAALLAGVGTAAGVALILRSRQHWALDVPNDRSLHSEPTPRSGGLAIMGAFALAVALAAWHLDRLPLQAVVLAFLLAGVSLVDDRAGLPIRVRLAVHLLAAGLFCAWLLGESAPWWLMLGSTLAVAAMTNFFNFMDGANGLAGGMAIAGFGTYAIAAWGADAGIAATCLALAAASAGFLAFNLPGRIFMGDGGSVPLGFLAAAIGLEGWRRGLWPAWFPFLAFAPFVVDATLTLTRRILRRERFWEAHREHYYQRLVRSGWSHARLAAWEYALMLACGAGALVARNGPGAPRIAAFATMAVCFVLACTLTDLRWRRHLARQPSP
jgi:UDP-N-acetylmuramyl pentapeptide phosphotransferase/UDP-N-acetylglucosamine-1-phosphate transferase